MAAETRGEDQCPAHPPAVAVSDQAQPAEVDLQLDTRRRVVHPHRRRPPARPATFHREPGQRPVRHDDAQPGQQDADLHDREIFGHPRPDPLLLAQQHPPRLAVTVQPVRAHPLHHLADQLLAELPLAAVPDDAQLDRGGDITPRRLSVDADPPSDRPFAVTVQPAPQRLLDLDHRNLPERHWASSSKTQPNDSPAGVGGPSGWSHDWQQGWSHPTGKTSGYLVPCGWQTTPDPSDQARYLDDFRIS
jgi:hypothetical protein